jgi:LPXTG-site transpeptidase (sortase) family protein
MKHRDGLFRGLVDVTRGDVIELSTAAGWASDSVDQIEIVQPDNVGVLRPRGVPSLNIVTCHAFYFHRRRPPALHPHAALKAGVAGRQLDNGSASARTQ